MPRILLLIILVWLLYRVLKRLAASAKQTSAPQQKTDEKIVQCAQCGLHIPESESKIKNDLVVCNNPDCKNQNSRQK